MTRLSRFTSIALLTVLLVSLLAACSGPIGSRGSTGSNQPPAVGQSSTIKPGAAPADHSSIQTDPQGDDIEQSLDNLANDLNSIDTLDDIK